MIFKALICWWNGHEWPEFEAKAKKAKGKNVYFRCTRCGEPECAYWDPRTKTVSWG